MRRIVTDVSVVRNTATSDTAQPAPRTKGAARRQPDMATRDRLVAWTRHLMVAHSIPTRGALARRLGLTRAAISFLLSGERTPGLDYLVRLHRVFHISADVLLDSDPPKGPKAKARR